MRPWGGREKGERNSRLLSELLSPICQPHFPLTLPQNCSLFSTVSTAAQNICLQERAAGTDSWAGCMGVCMLAHVLVHCFGVSRASPRYRAESSIPFHLQAPQISISTRGRGFCGKALSWKEMWVFSFSPVPTL